MGGPAGCFRVKGGFIYRERCRLSVRLTYAMVSIREYLFRLKTVSCQDAFELGNVSHKRCLPVQTVELVYLVGSRI